MKFDTNGKNYTGTVSAPEFYVVNHEGNVYSISWMTDEQAAAAGYVVRNETYAYGKNDNSFFNSLEITVPHSGSWDLYLLKDIENGNLTWVNTPWDQMTGTNNGSSVNLYTNGHSFTGSVFAGPTDGPDNSKTNCYLAIKGSENATLTNVTGNTLTVGAWNAAGSATVKNAQLNKLSVQSLGVCAVEGGKFDQIEVYTRYANKQAAEPNQIGSLTITGGLFKTDKVTNTIQNHDPATATVDLADRKSVV